MKKLLKVLVTVIIAVVSLMVIYLAVIIIWGTVTNYQPDEVTELEVHNPKSRHDLQDSIFTFLSWNVGYFGLGAEMDFFYDGGQMVRPTSEQVDKFTAGALKYLKSADSVDFIFLQETDRNSARTGFQDETTMIQQAMPEYTSAFAVNYNVRFVPLPFINPMGKVEMGQMTLSNNQPVSSRRYSYFSSYAWPKNLFMLDRCFLVSRFQLENGKELVLLNTHNSAYDAGGKMRDEEMPVIRDLMLKEFEKGNYVVAGGDWNQNPPMYDISNVNAGNPAVYREKLDDAVFPPEWQIVFDPQNPTNRDVDIPMSRETGVTIIDFFVLSPNVAVRQIKTLSQHFQFSDHEPVFLKISLKN